MAKLSVEEITDRGRWEGLLADWVSQTSFTQAWNWGEVQRAAKETPRRLAYLEQGQVVALAQVIVVAARRGRFVFVPHGPLANWSKRTLVSAVLGHLQQLARAEQALFLRVSPYLTDLAVNRQVFKQAGFLPAPIHMHAERTWTLDIRPPLDTLLKNMRKNTRYAIRSATKLGVKVTRHITAPAVRQYFYPLFKATASRRGFVPFAEKFIEQELTLLARDQEAQLFLGWYNNEVLAGALVIFHGGRGYYHHGASTLKYPKIPAAHAVQWAAIQEAKRQGCREYNFWGIAENETDPHHPWHGVTFFKQGFGGFATQLMHAQDYPLSPLYWLTYAFEQLRRRKRGF